MLNRSVPRTTSIYIHFPWCLKKCPYCDFVSYAKKEAEIDHEGYADAVIREIEARSDGFTGEIGSIFFGGGTPSLWRTGALTRVMTALRDRFRIATLPSGELSIEVTAECNPTSLDLEKARGLRAAGLNRLSIGVQSLDQKELSYLGRLHDGDGALRAIEGAFAAGFKNVSGDLIFGLPGQTTASAVAIAESLVKSGVPHLSAYQLTIEPGTQFGELARLKRLPLADDGVVADSFLAISSLLRSHGFEHYEISNYAKPGHRSMHNSAYWRGDDYFGFGTAAVGRIGRTRYRNEPDPARYMDRTRTLVSGVFGLADGVAESEEKLDDTAIVRERLMLGLRMTDGIDMDGLEAEGLPIRTREREKTLLRLAERGRIESDGRSVRIPRSQWLFCNDTVASLF